MGTSVEALGGLGNEEVLLVPMVAEGAPKACAIHKLRWGSDRHFQQYVEEEKEAAAKKSKTSGAGRDIYGTGRGHLPKSESVASESSDATGWGFYEDCEIKDHDSTNRLDSVRLQNRETPEYVLEDTLASQALWHNTAGTRPPQPAAERRKFELVWAQNFSESKVDYENRTRPAQANSRLLERLTCAGLGGLCSLADINKPPPPQEGEVPPSKAALGDASNSSSNNNNNNTPAAYPKAAASSSLTAPTRGDFGKLSSAAAVAAAASSSSSGGGKKRERERKKKKQQTELLLREQSPFGTSVTKSWQCDCCGELTSIMIRIPKYQIVRTGDNDVHAEYLVVCRLGTVTFGLWRRYSHFQRLADAIANNENAVDYQNTLWSWRCLRRRQRWFRCLDKDYLALKCFLLERFLHDAVFESSSSTLFTDFLEIKL